MYVYINNKEPAELDPRTKKPTRNHALEFIPQFIRCDSWLLGQSISLFHFFVGVGGGVVVLFSPGRINSHIWMNDNSFVLKSWNSWISPILSFRLLSVSLVFVLCVEESASRSSRNLSLYFFKISNIATVIEASEILCTRAVSNDFAMNSVSWPSDDKIVPLSDLSPVKWKTQQQYPRGEYITI